MKRTEPRLRIIMLIGIAAIISVYVYLGFFTDYLTLDKKEYCNNVATEAESVAVLKKQGMPLYLIVNNIKKPYNLPLVIVVYNMELTDQYRIREMIIEGCLKYSK